MKFLEVSTSYLFGKSFEACKHLERKKKSFSFFFYGRNEKENSFLNLLEGKKQFDIIIEISGRRPDGVKTSLLVAKMFKGEIKIYFTKL